MIAPRRQNPDVRIAFLTAGLGLLCLLPSMRGAITPTEWKHRQTFEIAHPGLTKIALPDATLDLTRAGFVDLRLMGPNGEEIPYAVHIPAPPTPTAHSPRNVAIELQPLSTQISIQTGTTQPVDSVVLATPAQNFVKAARIEISHDGNDWDLVAQGFQLARQPGLNAVSLPLGARGAPFIRITIDDARSAVVPFTGAVIRLAASRTPAGVPVAAEIVKRDEYAGETVLTVDLHARNLPLTLLEITSTDPLFARVVEVKQRRVQEGESVEHTVGVGSIHRSPVPQSLIREHLRVPLDFTSAARQQQIHITNGDSPPMTIGQVKLLRRPVWLIFNALNVGTHQVLTGNPQTAAPAYDLAHLVNHWDTIPEATLTFSAPESNPGYRPPEALSDTMPGAALDVGAWNFRKTVTPTAARVQEVELDLDVLAHAQRSLADLRLMRDGHQVPYLLERSAQLRSLLLTAAAADDPKTPQLSRWKLALPLAGLPVQRLTLVSSTPLFSRSLQIFEAFPDHRGETSRRTLTDRLQWRSTPDRPELTKTIELRTSPTSDALYLEIDNGDNPAIALGSVQAQYAVVRLFFRSEAKPVHLYYGAMAVSPPRYDIELIARQVLDEERGAAILGAEEHAHGRAGVGKPFSARQGGILLWLSLGLVVGVLLFVIARLLPKSTATKS